MGSEPQDAAVRSREGSPGATLAGVPEDMPDWRIHVLLIEDNRGDALLMRAALTEMEPKRFELEVADRLSTGLERLAQGSADIVLMDLGLPDSWGLDTLSTFLASAPDIPVIVLTASDDEELAAKALQMGAQDYLVKGQAPRDSIRRSIRYALERHRLREQRGRTEEALRTSRENFHAIVNNSPDGIVIVDTQGIARFVNRAAEDLLGREAREILGELLGLPIVAGAVTEVDVVRKSGEAGVAEMRLIPTDWQGERAHLISLHDVTERTRAADELVRAREKAEEASRAKSEFLSNVTHEIRTPLCSMQNALSNIQAGVGGQLDGTLREYVEMLEGDCRRLCALVGNLLDMSRFDAGRIFLEKAALGLREIAQQVVQACRSQAHRKRIRVRLEIAEATPPVYADEGRIRQVFTNLLGNAIKFTPEGGAVTIRAQERGEDVLVSVADTGMGIPAEHLESIFDRFFQLDRHPGAGAHGMGLGLAICKEIVSLHGGRIWAESEKDKGSTFLFTLPKAAPDVLPKKELVAAEASRRP